MDVGFVLGKLSRLLTLNLMVAITCVLVVIIHSWVLIAALRRIEASAERIATMVRDLHHR